jgi:hypothetical protein
LKQFKRGYRRCHDCQTEMRLETVEAAEQSGRSEPHLVCSNCGSTAPWAEIAEKPCRCGAEPVQRDFALSAPDRGLRLYITALSDLPLFHQDGRGLEAREACTACTACFVCKQPIDTQQCAWDELPLEGMQESEGLTHQFVYLHPECWPAYEVWRTDYLERLYTTEADRESAKERREHCLSQALCLECEKPLSLIDRFFGRLRHFQCSIKPKSDARTSKAKKSGKNSAKRAR